MRFLDIACAHLGFTNMIGNLPRMSVVKVVYGNLLTGNDWRWILQSKQKCVALIKVLGLKF